MVNRKPRPTLPSQAIKSSFCFLRGLFLVLSCFIVLSLILAVSITGKAEGGDRGAEPQFSDLFKRIDEKLVSSYLDLERIQPRPLLERALSSLELTAEEIYVEAFEPTKPYVAMHVEDKVEVLNLHDVRTREESIRFLEGVFDFLSINYRGDSTLNELRYAAANGYLSGIDPHTLVFTPRSFEEFEIHIRGEIFGVGMMVGGTESGKLEVKQVLKDTPARRAGFQKSDIISKINDESTINMTVMEAVQKIRGPLGTEVVLTVKRASAEDKNVLVTKAIAVKRGRVTIKSVESKLITDGTPPTTDGTKGGVGYVKVTNFDQKTHYALQENLARLRRENGAAIAGLILDLRSNSGGLLTQAVAMSDDFLKSGDIVVTARKGDNLQPTKAKFDKREPEYPIILLADEASASGAEIVLGALQKNNRALVLGTRSFGKGSVQQLQSLPHGAQLKITVSEYLIPGNISIQENGVVPDVLAQVVTLDEEYTDLFPTEHVTKERDYETHIVSKYKLEEEPSYRIKYLYVPPEEQDGTPSASERFISGDLIPETDPLVQMALDVLALAKKSAGQEPERAFNPRLILRNNRKSFEKLREEFYAEIVAKLGTLGIDWGTVENPAKPSPEQIQLELSYEIRQEPSRDLEDPVPVNMLLLTAKLTNKGPEPLHRIKAISRSSHYQYQDREFLFGKVAPGASVSRRQKIRLPYFPRAQNNEITLEVSGEDNEVFTSSSLDVRLPHKPRPAFDYSAELKNSAGSPIGKLSVGEDSRLELTIHNRGKGTAHKGVAILRNKTGRRVFLKKGRLEFPTLKPGESTRVEFRFDVRPGKLVDTYDFELVIYDSYSGEALTRRLEILAAGERGMDFPNGKRFAPPVVDLSLVTPEDHKKVLVTDLEELLLQATIRSSSQNFKTWVTNLPLTQRGKSPDKVYFTSSGGNSKIDVKVRLKLSPGVNLVTLVAKDGDGLEMRRSLIVRKR